MTSLVLNTETITCCDNGDLQLQLHLDGDPACSMLALRVAPWFERTSPDSPASENWDAEDYAALDMDEVRRLRDRLTAILATVEEHEAEEGE